MNTPNSSLRWKQRFSSYKKALSNLQENVQLSRQRELSKIEVEGLIKSFEYTYELAWNVIKDFYTAQGETNIQGSRDAFTMAFNRGLIFDGQVFMNMIQSRQLTSRTYNEDTARAIYIDIIERYFDAFLKLQEDLNREEDFNK